MGKPLCSKICRGFINDLPMDQHLGSLDLSLSARHEHSGSSCRVPYKIPIVFDGESARIN